VRTLVSMFDSVVVITSIASVLLCTRSVYRALRLGRVCVAGFTCVFNVIHSSCIDGDSCHIVFVVVVVVVVVVAMLG